MKQATAPPRSSTMAAGSSRVAGNTSLDRRLELAAPFERAMHCDLVRVIEVAADQQAHRDARKQFFDLQIVRSDAGQQRQRPHQHVIHTRELPRLFEGREVYGSSTIQIISGSPS